jgi:hypothetical protein
VFVVSGDVQAAGNLLGLSWENSLTLDIGGPAAATLSVGYFGVTRGTGNSQIDFGLGNTQRDLLAITSPPNSLGWPQNAGGIQFEFQNLGGLTTGVDYPLISYPSTAFGIPSPRVFALAPDLVAAGWAATFTTTATGVSVEFSRISEPSSSLLLAAGAAVLLIAKRQRWSTDSRT